MSLPVDHVFVINLDRRPEKWRRTQQLLASVGIAAERISAIDANGASHEAARTACKLSHIRTLLRAVAAGYRRIAVFEDDVLPAKQLCFDLLRDHDWRFVYLGATQVDWSGISPEAGFYRPHKTLGTWAMAIDHRYYERLIAAYAASLVSADLTLQTELANDPHSLVLYPNRFITDVSISDIHPVKYPQNFTDLCRWDLKQYNGTEALVTDDASKERNPWSSRTKVLAAPPATVSPAPPDPAVNPAATV